jgi:hypothetical protein
VFVRGNHEECARAGQGWFRFLDAAPWTAGRSCDDPRNDAAARHTAPYAVALDPQTSLIVFDSSTRAGSAAEFAREFAQAEALARTVPHVLFASHHPVLGLGLPSGGKPIGPSDPDMIAALQAARGGALFGPSVDMALHGHVHLFEALGFKPGGVRIAAFHTRVGFGFALLERRDALWRLTEYAEDGRPLLACEVAAPTLHCAPAAGH